VFWTLALAFFLIQTAVAGFPVHFVSMMVDGGATRGDAAAMAGVIGASLLVSRIVIGLALDNFPARLVGMLATLISAAGMFSLAFGGVEMAAVGAATMGFLLGAEFDLIAYMLSRYFPAAIFGRAFGCMYPVPVVGAIVSVTGYGVWYDAVGSYGPALTAAGVALIIAAAIFLLLPRYSSTADQARPRKRKAT
jgi:hypothetical protein